MSRRIFSLLWHVVIGAVLVRILGHRWFHRIFRSTRTDLERTRYISGYRHREVGLPFLGPIAECDGHTDKFGGKEQHRTRSINYQLLHPKLWVPGFSPISVDRKDFETCEQGFTKRVGGAAKYTMGKETAAGLARFTRTFCQNHFSALKSVLSFEEWLQGTPYTDARKCELNDLRNGCRNAYPGKKESQKVKGFIKLESYPEFKFARWINSRVDAFKAYCGRYFKSIEAEVYQLKFFAKHIPVPDRPKRVNELRAHHDWYCYQTDWTSMEKHFKTVVLKAIEFQVYKFFWQCVSDDIIRTILNTLSGVNHIRSRLGMHARVKATRMSGEMNTSLGNGLTNLIVFAYIVWSKGGEFDGLVEGDDGLFVSSVKVTSADYAAIGFDVKVLEVEEPLSASFCGIVCTPDLQIIVDPWRKLETFPWSSSFVGCTALKRKELLKAKALSLCYEAGNCPVIGKLARVADELAGDVTPNFSDVYRLPPTGFKVPPFNPTMSTRLLFQRRFGISVNSQLLCEELINKGEVSAIGRFIRPSADMQWFTARYAA